MGMTKLIGMILCFLDTVGRTDTFSMLLNKLKKIIADEQNELERKRKGDHMPDRNSELLVDMLNIVSSVFDDDGDKSSSAAEDSSEDDDDIIILEAESTPKIAAKSSPPSKITPKVSPFSKISPSSQISAKNFPLLKISPKVSPSSKISSGISPPPKISSGISPPSKIAAEISPKVSPLSKIFPRVSPPSKVSPRRRSSNMNTVKQATPIIQKRRSSFDKLHRHPYLGIDDRKMWDFVVMKMRQEKKWIRAGKKFARKPPMGLLLWEEYYDIYNKFDGEHENMHSPDSLATRFKRDLYPIMASSHLDWQSKVDFLMHSKYLITKKIFKGLEAQNDKMIIRVDKGVVIGVEPKVPAEARQGRDKGSQ